MVEVFKTNVQQTDDADTLIALIEDTFENVVANFDLDDCDRILRVQYNNSEIRPAKFIKLLKAKGFKAEVLPDTIPYIDHHTFSNFHKEKN